MTDNNQRPIPPQPATGFTAPTVPNFVAPPMAGQQQRVGGHTQPLAQPQVQPLAQPQVQPLAQPQVQVSAQPQAQPLPYQGQVSQQPIAEKNAVSNESFSSFGEVPNEYIASENKKNTDETGPYDNNFAADLGLPPAVLTTKVMIAIMISVCFFGLILGALFFGGGSAPAVSQQGLQGVVKNPEIPVGRRRCGIAEKTQGCTLYIMNAERRDREARDFYDEASRVTGVPVYTIKFGNVEYATSIIRPGYIAQINIPPIDK